MIRQVVGQSARNPHMRGLLGHGKVSGEQIAAAVDQQGGRGQPSGKAPGINGRLGSEVLVGATSTSGVAHPRAGRGMVWQGRRNLRGCPRSP
jgi:hypothetical protein